MANKQDPLSALKAEPKAAKLLGDENALKALLQSQEAQTLAGMFQKLGGDGLRQAAQSAAAGDPAALQSILEQVMKDPAGAKAVENISKKAPK